MALQELSVKETHTGYWVIQSGDVELSGAITRAAAEAECEVLRRIRTRAECAPERTDGVPERPERAPAS
jgi:hypothetical protein